MTMSVVKALLEVLELEARAAIESGDVEKLLEVVESQLLVAIMWYGGLRGNEPMGLLVQDMRGKSGTGIQRSRSGGHAWGYVLLVFRFATKGNREGKVVEVPIMSVTGEKVQVGMYCQRYVLSALCTSIRTRFLVSFG